MLGQNCRFYPSCSSYAIEALQTHGALRGSWLAARRLVPLPSVERRRRRSRAAQGAQAFPLSRLRLQPLLINTSMEINKRTILWIVFTVSLVILWNNWMVSNGKQSMFSPAPPAKVATAPATAATGTTGVPAAAVQASAVPGAVPGTAGQPAAPRRCAPSASPSPPTSSRPRSTPSAA